MINLRFMHIVHHIRAKAALEIVHFNRFDSFELFCSLNRLKNDSISWVTLKNSKINQQIEYGLRKRVYNNIYNMQRLAQGNFNCIVENVFPHCGKKNHLFFFLEKRIITKMQANTSDFTLPVFVGESSAIGADSKLSQELTKLLFDLTALQNPLIANTISSTEAVAIIHSWIIKSRHFANVLE